MPKGKGKSRLKKEKDAKRFMRKRTRERYTERDPEYQSLAKQLLVHRLKLKDVPGDGNCLFRALADQLRDEHVTHQSLRTDIVEYMRRFKEDFEPFLDEEGISYDEYIDHLMKNGTYGGNDTIVAFARLYNCTVVIHQPNEPPWEVHSSFKSKSQEQYHIAYLNGEHYCSVVPCDSSLSLKPNPPPLHKPAATVVSEKGKQMTPHLNHTGAEGMLGMYGENSFKTVMEATGCKDEELVKSVLKENSYNAETAIVELFQIMDISGDIPPPLSDIPLSPLPLPVCGETLKQRSDDSTTHAQLPAEKLKKRSHRHDDSAQISPRPHLSNRERKEMAKKQRKERKTNERRKEKAEKTMATLDLHVESLVI